MTKPTPSLLLAVSDTTTQAVICARKTQRAFSLAFIHLVFIFALALSTPLLAIGQKTAAGPQVEIIEPTKPVGSAQDSIRIAFKIRNASQRRIRVRLESDLDNIVSSEIPLTTKGEHSVRVNLFEGKNRISFIVFEDDEPKSLRANAIEVSCTGRWCKKPFSLKPDSVAAELGAEDGERTEDVATTEEPAEETTETGTSAKDKKPKPAKGEVATAKEKPAENQKGAVHIDSPKSDRTYVDAKTVSLKLKVDRKSKTDATKNLKKVFITVLNEIKPSTQIKDIVYPDDVEKPGELTVPVNIGRGSNEIVVVDPANRDDERDSVKIVCEGQCSGDAEAPKSASIKIAKPDSPVKPVNEKSVDWYLTIAKTATDQINNVQYEIYQDGQPVFTGPKFPVTYSGDDPATIRVPVKIARGDNTVRFFDPDHFTNKDHEAFAEVNCTGDKCASDFLVAAFPSNTQNSRAVIGFEQAGASSKDSEFKPFFDFFFTAPLLYRCANKPADNSTPCVHEDLPRLAAWGQVRIASTPDQVAAAAVFPTTLVNQVGSSSSSIDLVQSFDFLAGLEGRIKSANGSFLSLIPGIRQRTHFYLAAGGGAINPLNARKEVAQVFTIPKPNSPQRDDFIARYGLPPTSDPEKEFVGLVPLDRDRFLRQWYAGIRLKTFYCDDKDCTTFKNNFPAIFDFMFGQNEAVTGGRLKYSVPDPTDSTKSIRKNSYVLRFDAFYPFPIREANFLYFYGSALMKIGAGGVRIQNPLFLENPGSEIKITDPKVYIPPASLQERFQPNRDYYKIGVGVNLTELFNRNKN